MHLNARPLAALLVFLVHPLCVSSESLAHPYAAVGLCVSQSEPLSLSPPQWLTIHLPHKPALRPDRLPSCLLLQPQVVQ